MANILIMNYNGIQGHLKLIPLMIQFLFVFADWGLLALRLVLGAIMVRHGWPKIKDLRAAGTDFAGMGFRPGLFWATIVAIAEFIGGLALLGGFFTQFFASLLFIQFLVIILKLRRRSNFSQWELDGLIAAAALALAVLGAGQISLDAFWNLVIY